MESLKKYFKAARKVEKEYSQYSLPVQGKLPDAIQPGTLFRNGNGRFEHHGTKYEHLFDGDGMITKFEFRDSSIFYSNRYVRTKEFVAEEKAGKMLYRSFGTNIPGGSWKNFLKMRFKNAANTSVIWHGNKMLALWEGGIPHEIDPVSLKTIGRYDYNGILQNHFSLIDKWINPELPFSAHPKFDHKSGAMLNFGTAAGTKQRLLIYRVNKFGTAAIDQAIQMDEVTFTHDFVYTQSGKKVFFLTPVAFDLFKSFSGLTPPVASMKIDKNKKTKIIIVDDNGVTQELAIDFCFVFHFANGFETDEGKIIVDGYILDNFPPAEEIKQFLEGEAPQGSVPLLTRFELNLKDKQVSSKVLSEHPGELPFVRPDLEGLPYRYVWNAAGPKHSNQTILTGYAKIDTQKRETFFKDFHPSLTGEPVFIPKPNGKKEDDGWLLCLLFDAQNVQTKLLILDAADLSELATATLPHNIPLGFHGFWTKQIFED